MSPPTSQGTHANGTPLKQMLKGAALPPTVRVPLVCHQGLERQLLLR